MSHLKSDLVFVDTSILRQARFDLSGRVFDRFRDLCKNRTLRLLVPDISRQEAESKLQDFAKEIATHLRGAIREGRAVPWIARQGTSSIVSKKAADIALELQQQVESFYSDCRAKALHSQEADTSEVFEKYFERQPPFDSDKKKHEFPDAFMAECLLRESREQKRPVYVVSCDKDFASICNSGDGLIPLESIAQLLDIHAKTEEVVAVVGTFLQSHGDAIKEMAREQFIDLSFHIEDQWGDFEDVQVEDIEIGEATVIEADNERISLLLMLDVSFEGTATYEDESVGFYDSEDKEWRSFGEYIHRAVETQSSKLAEVTFLRDLAGDPEDAIEEFGYCHGTVVISIHDEWDRIRPPMARASETPETRLGPSVRRYPNEGVGFVSFQGGRK